MIKKIILVGCTTQNNKVVNGQSMMFQLFVDKLQEKKINTLIIDFGKSIASNSENTRVSGKFSFTKLFDNFFITCLYIFTILTNPSTSVYITTSQSKVGFIRDYLFINIAYFLERKIIAHQFGSNYDKFFASQSNSFKEKIISTFEKTDKIVVEGDFTKSHFSFLKDYESKVISIPNGLPEKIESKNITSKNLYPQKEVHLLYLSNLIETKGYWDVLKAINLLINKYNANVKAVFSGKFLGGIDDKMFSSPKKAQVEFFKFIKENNLTGKIKYFEGLYGEAKKNAFTTANFFILPSYYINEGQPVSIVEALAYGCVPIVTDYRLISDMVNIKNGFFVAPKSPEEIAAIINKMIENPARYNAYSDAGINFYLENFTADKFIDKVLSLF